MTKHHASIAHGRHDPNGSKQPINDSGETTFPGSVELQTNLRTHRHFVVGIGVSFASIKASQSLLLQLPSNRDISYVIVLDRRSGHDHALESMLSRTATMPVIQVSNSTAIKPNCIYVTPPDYFVEIIGDKLVTRKPILHEGNRFPIDFFFRSIATAYEHHALAIVLSGIGPDGCIGIQEIQASGGSVIAESTKQSPLAERTNRPLAAEMADHICYTENLPECLLQHLQHRHVLIGKPKPKVAGPLDEVQPAYQTIFEILHQNTNNDFQCYKSGTVNRRIQRRMTALRINSPDEYVKTLRKSPDEVQILFQDLLIGVSSFFRQPQAWETLNQQVIQSLVSHQNPDEKLRIWVPGCSTGQDAYSVLMLVLEQMERQNRQTHVQVYATDLDPQAIEFARWGHFSEKELEGVSKERRAKYFIERSGSYEVSRRLRTSTVFAIQNLIADPPFSHLDLIVCRNLMIYLRPEVQQSMVQLFHYALNANGHLFLGGSETLGRHRDLFETVSQTWRIYQKLESNRKRSTEIAEIAVEKTESETTTFSPLVVKPRIDPVSIAQTALLNEFTPAAVLVDWNLVIHYYHGEINEFLEIPTGTPTDDLLIRCRPSIRSTVRMVMEDTRTTGQPASGTASGIRLGDDQQAVAVRASKVSAGNTDEPFYLVSFNPLPKPESQEDPPVDDEVTSETSGQRVVSDQHFSSQQEIELLKHELEITREDLKRTISDLRVATNKAKSSGVVAFSINQRLQSTNEELETSREELQSLNEELSTLNQQLEDKVLELEGANNDLTNLLIGTEIATIFLDDKLRIRRFTPATRELFSLIDSDVGRPISDLTTRCCDPKMHHDALKVLEQLVPIDREVSLRESAADSDTPAETIKADTQRWFIRRTIPYRTDTNQIDGIVITYTEISSLKQSAADLARRERQTAVIAELGRLALTGTTLAALFRQTVSQIANTLGTNLCKVLRYIPDDHQLIMVSGLGWQKGLVGEARVDDGPDSQAGYTLASHQPVIVSDLRQEKRFSGPPLLTDHGVISGLSVVIGPNESPWGVLGTHSTEHIHFTRDDANFIQAVANVLWEAISRRQAEQHQQRQLAEINAIYKSAPVGLCIIDSNLQIVRANERFAELSGIPLEAHPGKRLEELSPDLAASLEAICRRVIQNGVAQIETEVLYDPHQSNSTQSEWLVNCLPLMANETVVGVNTVIIDITDRKRRAKELIDARNRVTQILASINDGFVRLDKNWKYTYVNQAALDLLEKTEDELVGKHFWEVFPDLMTTPFYQALTTAKTENRTLEIEEYYPPHDRWYRCRHYPSPEGISVFFTDISELRAAQQDLRRSEELVRTIAENSTQALIMMDQNGVCTYCNKAWLEMTGFDAEEIRAQSLHHLVHHHYPDGRIYPIEECPIDRALPENFDVRTHEDVFFRKDGTPFPVLCAASPIFENDKPVSTVIEVRDMTEFQKAKDEARASEDRLRVAAQAAQFGMYDVDLQSGKVFWSTELKRILGVDDEFAINFKYQIIPSQFIHRDDCERVQQSIQQSFTKKAPTELNLEFRIIAPNNDLRWVNVKGRTISGKNSSGGATGRASGTVVDISSRKIAQIRLQELNEYLEQRVRQRAEIIKLLHDITTACHHARTAEEATEYVLQQFCKHNDWQIGYAYIPTEDSSDSLTLFKEYVDLSDSKFDGFRQITTRLQFGRGEGLPGRVFESGKPEYITQHIDTQVAIRRESIQAAGICTAAAYPVVVGNRVVAVLEFFSNKVRESDDRILDAMESIGSQLGRVVERTNLQREIADLASSEQQKIGNELHDTLIQQLAGSEMMAESLRQKVASNQMPTEREVANLANVLNASQRDVRRLHRGLMPVEVDAAGLMTALEHLAQQTRTLHNVDCDFRCDKQVLIQDNMTATYLYRIAQEAVHNALKHASCQQILIRLSRKRFLQLSIHDNGCGGINLDQETPGCGLRIMRYRAEVIGAKLEIDSRAGKGTTITCNAAI